MHLIDQLNAILPQTQCGQCRYKGCKPYAEALVAGTADINQCPPGGDEGILEIAKFLGVDPKPLNPAFGNHKPKQIAYIREEDCIGCVKCIAVCPVDAIIGAAKMMHTVIANECTGCELCLAPCPVDCIELKPLQILLSPEEIADRKRVAMQKHQNRLSRIETAAKSKAERFKKLKEKSGSLLK